MNRIDEAFKRSTVFIPFITCGDPTLEVTEALVYALEDAGAGIIELGIPFSDPTAEGPVLQSANMRALAGGVTVSGILKMVERIRRRSGIPLIFMTYANVVFSHGTERFVKDMAGAGLDGLILPDVPFEEREEFSEPCKQNGIVFPPLIAPTSRERISRIAEAAEGFVYCVSSLGVTGMRSRLSSDIRGMVQAVKKKKDIPCAIGFGISTPEQAREMAGIGDGVIVGSAIVKLCGEFREQCIPSVSVYARQMASAVQSIHR